jgi:hypothetical protein
MHALLALVLAATSVGGDRPRSYLASINVELGADESLSGFEFATWGVQFDAVCHIPSGWFIQTGNDAALRGVLKGQGSHGATWLNKGSKDLRGLVLITMWTPVQRADKPPAYPATFKGHAVIDDGNDRRPLTHLNVRLTPATACPNVAIPTR